MLLEAKRKAHIKSGAIPLLYKKNKLNYWEDNSFYTSSLLQFVNKRSISRCQEEAVTKLEEKYRGKGCKKESLVKEIILY